MADLDNLNPTIFRRRFFLPLSYFGEPHDMNLYSMPRVVMAAAGKSQDPLLAITMTD